MNIDKEFDEEFGIDWGKSIKTLSPHTTLLEIKLFYNTKISKLLGDILDDD